MYETTPTPIRITIDFRDSVHPARGWILGRLDGSPDRVDVLAVNGTNPAHRPVESLATAADGDCTCPAFCERDHDLD